MLIQITLEINAPASITWDVLGERFADVSDWAHSIVKSSLNGSLGEGAVRTCHIKAVGPIAAGQIKEELTHFDRESYALTYVVLSGAPNLMKSIENAWTIDSLGENRCEVTSRATFEMKWWALPLAPLMRMPLNRAVRDFMEQLKHRVEGGLPKA